MTRALSQRPTTLSLGSIDLLMECSKDHITYEVIGEQVEDERYRVVDGVIYYQDMIFFTRISKLKMKALHAAHDSFLSSHEGLMETYQTIKERFSWKGSSMHLITSLLTAHGKSCVFVLIDHITSIFILLPFIYSAFLHKRASLSLDFRVFLRPRSVREIVIPCMALGKCCSILGMLS